MNPRQIRSVFTTGVIRCCRSSASWKTGFVQDIFCVVISGFCDGCSDGPIGADDTDLHFVDGGRTVSVFDDPGIFFPDRISTLETGGNGTGGHEK